jgi:hypothetical protein
VCLSLLGTWQGPGWVPGTSTLSQVLLSIQSQIMCDVPYANEPSFEAIVAQPAGKRAVAKHNAMIRLANIRHAMLEPLRVPKPGFKRAIGEFFVVVGGGGGGGVWSSSTLRRSQTLC